MLAGINRKAIYSFAAVVTIGLCCRCSVTAHTLQEKLHQLTEYQPPATSPEEQLVNVARHFQIPIGIEWVERDTKADPPAPLNFTKGSVLELLTAIVDRGPKQALIVEDRIVCVFAPAEFHNPLNFLNFDIERYCVTSEPLLGAEFVLRLEIDQRLYPDKFKNGFAGGYGGGEKDFWIKEINICINHTNIRDVLTEIAAQSGKAGWLATLKPDELHARQPFWKGVPLNEYGTSPLTGRWHFFVVREQK